MTLSTPDVVGADLQELLPNGVLRFLAVRTLGGSPPFARMRADDLCSSNRCPDMWFDMRKEDLGFIRRAPVVQVSQSTVAIPRTRVFATFTDPQSWPHWFPNVRAVSYAGAPPYGVGTIRRAHVGGTYWVEEVIAWETDVRWAWTVTRASVPFAQAQVEAFEFSDAEDATRVHWTLALEPRLLARLGAPFAPRVINRLFSRAMQNLSAYVRRPAGSPTAG